MLKIDFYGKWREYLWYYAPLILWIIVIFIASSSTGSMSNTSRLVRPLLLWLVPDISEASLLIVHGFVRKLAHFIVYFILGLFAARAGAFAFRNYRQGFWIPWALLLVLIVAALDETNQSLLVSRTGSIYDVLLDVAAGLTAIMVWVVFVSMRKQHS